MTADYIKGSVVDAGGGMVTISVDRDTMAYPESGAEVTLSVDREHEPPIYMIRRTDEYPMGDSVWDHARGPNDWRQAEIDAVGWDEPIEYEIVRLVPQVVARRTIQPASPEPPLESNPLADRLIEKRTF
jgi:hypothetical protein